MNNATKIMLPIGCLILISAIPNAFAHTEYYNIGYSQGQTKASNDYYVNDNGHNDYNPRCPTNDSWNQNNGPHSSNFCAGFIDGYIAQWTSLDPQTVQRIQQSSSQSSGISIRGSNNDVTVNQQTNNNVGGQNGYGYGHSGVLPRCVILCSNIRVN